MSGKLILTAVRWTITRRSRLTGKCVYRRALRCLGVMINCLSEGWNELLDKMLPWYCMDRVSSCNMYAVQKDTQSVFNEWVYSALMLALHVSELTGPSSGAFVYKQNFVYLVGLHVYRVSQGECARLRENVPYVKVHRYNPKHLRMSEVERLRR